MFVSFNEEDRTDKKLKVQFMVNISNRIFFFLTLINLKLQSHLENDKNTWKSKIYHYHYPNLF